MGSTKADPPAQKRDKRPPLTVGDQLAAGPKFVPWLPLQARQDDNICVTCGGPGPVDVETHTCRPCWRCWRWSTIRERDITPAR